LAGTEAVTRAEEECLGDAELREIRRAADAVRRAVRNDEYIKAFAGEIRKRYPGAPADAADQIAAHACQVHSNRIGRTASAKDFDPSAIDLAVQAYVRHRHTNYDDLMAEGVDRLDARAQVRGAIDEVLNEWRGVA
jgi:hypothetical protein